MTISRRGVLSGLAAAAISAMTAVTGLAVTSGDSAATCSADDCCCIERDGKLICTITGEELDECCCR